MTQHGIEHVILNGMLGSLLFLALCYVLFLGNMVFNIVERRGLEAEARTLGNEVSELELTYLSLSSSLDVGLSKSFGFEEIKPSFATRKPLNTVGLGSNKSSNGI